MLTANQLANLTQTAARALISENPHDVPLWNRCVIELQQHYKSILTTTPAPSTALPKTEPAADTSKQVCSSAVHKDAAGCFAPVPVPVEPSNESRSLPRSRAVDMQDGEAPDGNATNRPATGMGVSGGGRNPFFIHNGTGPWPESDDLEPRFGSTIGGSSTK